MSDVHGNLNALNAVLAYVEKEYDIRACMLLGDLIDYGMHSNEVLEKLSGLSVPVLCNIRGNHEQAIINEVYERFSSIRGKECAKHTREMLNENSWNYLESCMSKEAKCDFNFAGKRCLAVHGCLADENWKSLKMEQELEEYSGYDWVFSGHSHVPHYGEKYYASEDAVRRNKKKTIFVNPGSVGQPRNLNCLAQFAIVDFETERVFLEKVEYDIEQEQSAFDDTVDIFYKERLTYGV